MFYKIPSIDEILSQLNAFLQTPFISTYARAMLSSNKPVDYILLKIEKDLFSPIAVGFKCLVSDLTKTLMRKGDIHMQSE